MNERQPTDLPADSRRPARINAIDALALFTRGLAMGVADVIPGVSGGTIALISGIYERFIGGLRSLSGRFLFSLARGRVDRSRRELLAMHWEVLVPLGLGIVLAMLSMSKLVTGLMEDHPGPTYAAFFGLILASSWMPLARTRARSWKLWAALVLAAVSAWVFVGMSGSALELEQTRQDSGAETTIYASKVRHAEDASSILSSTTTPRLVLYDPKNLILAADLDEQRSITVLRSEAELESFGAEGEILVVLEERRASLPFIFVSGMIAISAMILPGISGSFLLLFLGQYQAVFTTAHRVVGYLASLAGREQDVLTALSGRSVVDDVLFLGFFFAGVGVGLIAFSRVVGWLLDHAHDITMAALTGIMIGALRQPGGVVLDSVPGSEAGGYWTACAVSALGGAAIVLGLHFADVAMRARRLVPEDSQAG